MLTGAALLSGILAGLGPVLSGMMDPARVLGFLDLAGGWDPSLTDRFDLPTETRIDLPLVRGAALLGSGCGLPGFCRGPALASLTLGLPRAMLSVMALLIGMALHDRLRHPAAPSGA